MEILDFKTEMLGDVAGLFNRGVADVPNCWPVEEADFAGATAAVSGGECGGGPSVEDQALSVATLGGEVVGFAHIGITARNNNSAFLSYSNHGYRVVDWTCQLSKSLDLE